MDKIYKILVDILALKAGFSLANFFIQSNFFHLKTIKSRIGFFQGNGNKVVYLSSDPNMGLLKVDFHLYIEYYVM